MGFTRKTRARVAGIVATGTLLTGAVIIPQMAIASNTTIVATASLNVRLEPTTNSQILGVLSSGEQVERRGDAQGEWTPVRYNGQDAWVFSAYTSLGGVESATGGRCSRCPSPNCTITESWPWISMFSAPGISNSGCSRP